MGELLKLVAKGCLILLFLTSNWASIQSNDQNGSIIYPETLYLIGVADGKGFFVDNDQKMNWTSAKDYCESFNMKLASITSETQETLLNNSYNFSSFAGAYWTSGRDVLDLRQFIWDSENKQPDSGLAFARNQLQLTCLYYLSGSGDSFLRNYDCAYEMPPFCDTGNKNGSSIYSESLHLVGVVDGKSFYAETAAFISWTDAKAYCESMNMQLATITSLAQAAMLNSSYDAEKFFDVYWTSARDVLNVQQFAWDKDNKALDNYLEFRQDRHELSCLYYASSRGNSYLANVECNFEHGLRPLCDTGDRCTCNNK